MTDYLYVSDKWDNYTIDNEKGVEWAALDLLTKRVEDDFWYYGEDAEHAKKIVENHEANSALIFLLNRRDHEYEWVEVKSK